MPTISDIAKAAGVSIASVSYVLNNRQGEVSERTRERVLQAMRDLNYRPSPLFMRKHATKSEVLGVAIQHPSLTTLTDHPYYTLILDGILSVTTAIGWDLIMFTTSCWSDFHKAMRQKCDGRCDGVIMVGLASDIGLIEVFKERGMPFVCANMGHDIDGASTVDIDNAAASHDATDYLVALGHRRIACLPGQRAYPTSIGRSQGFLAALAEKGLPFDADLMIDGAYTRESGYERGLRLLALEPQKRPTAIMCGSDMIALGVLAAARELGVNVSGELSVLGFDDIPFAATSDPKLTTVHQPLVEIGRSAAEMLLRHINDYTDLGDQSVLRTHVVERGSTGPAKN